MRKSIKIGKWKLEVRVIKHRRRIKTRRLRTPNSELPSVREMRGILKDDDEAEKTIKPRDDWQNQVI